MKEIDEKNEDESASYDEYITILRRHNKDEQYEINVQITFVQRRGLWTGRNLKESKENAPR